MALWLTKQIELLDRIGLGATGEVWKANLHASRRSAPRVIAVKRMFGRATAEESERLFAEARVLEKMNHANVARFLFTGFSDSREPFLAMEFVEGVTLDEHMKLFPLARLPLDNAAHFARQIAAAIDYVASHAEVSEGSRQYLVHGDLKPRNILITLARQLKVIDFGSARHVNPEVTNTLTGVEFTPRYAPPEVDGGMGSKITEIFSLGAIYFEMLTGKKAIDGETLLKRVEAREKFYLRRNVAQREKCLLESGVDSETTQLVQGLLSKKTRERERCFRLLNRQGAAEVVRETFGYADAVFTPPVKSKRVHWLGGLTAVAAAAAVVLVVPPVLVQPISREEMPEMATALPAPSPLLLPPLLIEVAEKGKEAVPEPAPLPRVKASLATKLPSEVKRTSREPAHHYALPPTREVSWSNTELVPVNPNPKPLALEPVIALRPAEVTVPAQVPRLLPLAPREPASEVLNLLPPPKVYANDTASFN
jgi:serine/threonine protein kinase